METKSSLVTKAIGSIFWLTLAGVVVMLALLVFFFTQGAREQVTFTWPLDRELYLTQTSIDLVPRSPQTVAPKIGSDRLAVSFHTTDPEWRMVVLVVFLLLAAFVLAVTYLLRQIARSVETGNPFSIQNRNRIRWLGVLVMLTVPAEWVGRLATGWLLHRHFEIHVGQLQQVRMPMVVLPELAYQNIFFGLVIFMIAEIFQQGIQMKSESDLTI